MKACVFGAGAIGGHVAARLWKGGAQVSVLARGANLVALQQGLSVTTPDETIDATVTASDSAAALGPQDVVFVSVKAPALASVAAAIGPLLGPDTPVVFLMNGIQWWYYHAHGGPQDGTALPLLDPGGALAQAVGVRRAIGGVVHSACTVRQPGHIHVEHARNRLVLGEPDGSRSDRLAALAAPLVQGGLPIDISEQIRTAIWDKLLLNLGLGPLGVLTGSPPRGFFTEPALQQATMDVITEAAAIARAMGCDVSPNPAQQVASGLTSGHKTSILQDLELGRPMEIDALYTIPLQMARERGVATPVLDLVAALVRARARTAGLYGG